MIQDYFSKIDFSNIEDANRVLRIIVKKIVVHKNKKTPKDDFEVEIYLNISALHLECRAFYLRK